MITVERLNPSEFDLLAFVDDGFTPDPANSIAVVARNESGIIGRIFILAPAHVEGVYIQPHWRGGSLLKQLVQAAELEAKAEGVKQLMVYAKDEYMADYIERLGYQKMPYTVWERKLCP